MTNWFKKRLRFQPRAEVFEAPREGGMIYRDNQYTYASKFMYEVAQQTAQSRNYDYVDDDGTGVIKDNRKDTDDILGGDNFVEAEPEQDAVGITLSDGSVITQYSGGNKDTTYSMEDADGNTIEDYTQDEIRRVFAGEDPNDVFNPPEPEFPDTRGIQGGFPLQGSEIPDDWIMDSDTTLSDPSGQQWWNNRDDPDFMRAINTSRAGGEGWEGEGYGLDKDC